MKRCRAIFKIKYEPGTLEAVACDNAGRETGRSCLRSADGPVKPRLLPEKNAVRPREICYVDVVMADEHCTVESNRDTLLQIHVEGGELLAFGSANPRSEERYDTGSHTSYYGRALAVIRAGNDSEITVTVWDGQEQTEAKIPIKNL